MRCFECWKERPGLQPCPYIQCPYDNCENVKPAPESVEARTSDEGLAELFADKMAGDYHETVAFCIGQALEMSAAVKDEKIKRLRGEIAEACAIIRDLNPLPTECRSADVWLARNKER